MENEGVLKHTQFDFALFAAVLLLCAFGLVMVFSASYYYAADAKGIEDPLYYLRKQSMYLGIGFAGLLLLSWIDYHTWDKLKVIFLVATLILMALVIVAGTEHNHAKRWLTIPGVGEFQPSEFAKFALVLYMSAFMARWPERMKDFTRGTVPMLMVMGIICILILLQKNMSMMVIVLITGVVMLFIGGVPLKHLFLLGICAVPVLFLAVKLEDYRIVRLKIFMDPWSDPQGSGYQLVQSLYAFGSGGIFGKGLNFSRQKLLFLTYGESDFIFGVIGEELGLIGCIAVMCAYVFIAYRGIMIAIRCKDRFGSLLAAGISCVIAMQAAINIGVATSSLPTTGQTLPFVSAGGSSLVIFMFAVGILLNISKNIDPV